MTTLKTLQAAVAAGRREEALALLAGGVRAQADGGDRPLLVLAARAGDLELTSALLRAGAPPEKADPYGVSPLEAAASAGHGEVVEALLAAGARPDRQRYEGRGWLGALAAGGLREHLRAELAGLAAEQRERALAHAASAAARAGREATLALALEAGAPVTDALLLDAAEGGLEARLLGWLGPSRPATLADDEGLTLLHRACQGARSLRLVQVLLERGARINAAATGGYYEGWTPLHFAAHADAPELIRLLLARGADPKARAHFVSEPLMVAASNKRYGAFLALLEAGGVDLDRKLRLADILESAHQESSLLHWAIAQERADLVDALLSRGADPRAEGRYRQRPLHAAAERGLAGVVRRLLDAGAPVDERATYKGRTALMQAADAGQDEVAHLLVARGAEVLARDGEGASMLLHACRGGLTWLARLALDRDPSLANTPDTSRHLPLHEALSWNHAETARLLLERGADPAAKDLIGSPPILNAVHCPALLPELLARGVDVDAPDTSGNTALSRAVEWGRLDLVQTLLAGGARADGRYRGTTPLLAMAAGAGRLELVEALLGAGADPAAAGRDGRTALEEAMAAGQAAVARRLEAAGGAGALARAVRPGSVSPLHHAVARGDLAYAKELLARGHPPDPADARGATPLHDAARRNRPGLVAALLEAGADPEREDGQGFRPLHLAARDGALEAAEALLVRAQPDAPSRTGHTPAHLAARGEHVFVLERLARAGVDPNAKVARGPLAGWGVRRLLTEPPDRADWIDRPCPACGHRELWQTDYRILEGNPETPSSNTDVRFDVDCRQCAARLTSPRNDFAGLYPRGGRGTVWHWDRQREAWAG